MNLVEQIVNAMTSEVQTALGIEYAELEYLYEVEKNAFTNNSKRFGIAIKSASSSITPTRAYTLDHEFEVVVTDNYFNKEDSDLDQREKIISLYSKIDDVTKRIYARKAGIPAVVFFVTLSSISEPEFINDDNIAVLRAVYIIKYRNNID